jgi:hypothetical protein
VARANGNRAVGGTRRLSGTPLPDRNATGAPAPLPGPRPGHPGRELHEREAVPGRSSIFTHGAPPTTARSDLAEMSAYRVFALLADNVRDYAVFLMDPDGIITYWGEGARLMKW